MKLAIMQPYFFPYIGYWQLINSVDTFIIYDNLNFIKEKWVNRNRLLAINGEPFYFRVPLLDKSSYKKIKDISIDFHQKWKRKILDSIYFNYKRSAFFEEVFPVIQKSMETDFIYLTDLIKNTIRVLADYLDIQTKIIYDVTVYEPLEKELYEEIQNRRNELFPNQDILEKKVNRVISICKNEGALTFVNPIGGQELYDKKLFKEFNIELFFVKTLPYEYKQNSTLFYKDLSIIDVLMNCGKEQTKLLLNNYEFI